MTKLPSNLPSGVAALMQAAIDRREAAGLRVTYISPYTGKQVTYLAANEENRADFCRRVEANGGQILS